MIRLVGAILVVLGSGAFGIGKAIQYRLMERQMHSFLSALELLRCELNYTMHPLPKALEQISLRIEGPCGCFLHILGKHLSLGNSRKDAMQHAFQETKGLILPNDVVFAIMELFENIGRYDVDGENRVLRLGEQRLRAAALRLEQEKRPLAKSYAMLGLSTGLAVVILLI